MAIALRPGRFWGWKAITFVIIILISIPILILFFQAFSEPAGAIESLKQRLLPLYLVNTLAMVLGVGVMTLLLGLVPAWLVTTCHFPGRKQLDWLLIMPLAIPSFISGIAYSGLTDYAGPIRIFLRSINWLPDIYMDILTLPGAIFVMAVVLYPYVYLIARAVFVNQSGILIDASRNLGLSPVKTFFKVVLPVSWPAIFSGLSLVIMEVLNDYGTVKYFGVPTFTTGIFREWLSLGNLQGAVSLSMILLLLVLFFLLLEHRISNKRRFASLHQSPLRPYELNGIQRAMATLTCLLPFFAGFIIPVIQMVFWFRLTFSKIQWENFWSITLNSLSLNIATALILVLMSLIIAYTYRISKSRGMIATGSTRILQLGYATPGAVIAVGIIIFISTIDSALLFASTTALIFGYCVRFFAVSFNPIQSKFAKYSEHLEDAAFSLGTSSSQVLKRVFLPLLQPGLLAALMLVFVDVTKELSLTLILRPFNFETLATNAYQYAKDELPAYSAPGSLLIVLIGMVPVYYLNKTLIKHATPGR